MTRTTADLYPPSQYMTGRELRAVLTANGWDYITFAISSVEDEEMPDLKRMSTKVRKPVMRFAGVDKGWVQQQNKTSAALLEGLFGAVPLSELVGKEISLCAPDVRSPSGGTVPGIRPYGAPHLKELVHVPIRLQGKHVQWTLRPTKGLRRDGAK